MPTRAQEPVVPAALTPGEVAAQVLLDLKDLPYLWPCRENGYLGKDPADGGMDCSGAVQWARYKAGLIKKTEVRRYNADALYRMLPRVSGKGTVVGDLVFYGTEAHVNHVMLLVGDGKCIGESGGGPRCTTVEISRKVGARMQIKKVAYRNDIVGFRRIA